MHTVTTLKADHKTLAVAKAHHGIKAASWQALANKLNKPASAKKLTITELKAAIYQRFLVASTPELRKSKKFVMATDGMGIASA
jgi:hypothetical protein